MKKIFLLLSVLFFVEKNCEAQNLVPNGDFESFLLCPDNSGGIGYAVGWTGFSSEYYNSCDSLLFGVPSNWSGFQNAASGNGYAGLISYPDYSVPWYREFIQAQLSSAIVPGTKYFLCLKVSLVDSSHCSSNNIGMLLSTIPYDISGFAPMPTCNCSQLFSTNIINDKINWTQLSTSFVADSAYQFVLIGNFFDNAHTSSYTANPPCSQYAYYYIDDVFISTDSLECYLNPEGIYPITKEKYSFSLYPNPTTQELNINLQQPANEIEITDAIGRVVAQAENKKQETQIDVHSLSAGIYFVRITFMDGSVAVKKFVKG